MNYDNWKLDNPYDDDYDNDVEVFKSLYYNYYSTDEICIISFDRKIENVANQNPGDLDKIVTSLAEENYLFENENEAFEHYLEMNDN